MQIKTVKAIVPYLFNARVTPLFIGQTGVGKTETVAQIAKDCGFDRVLSFKLGNLQDQADLLGLMEFIKVNGQTRTTYARPDFWPTNPEEKVLIFFDEINRANRQLVQPIMELALEFRHHDYVLPEGCRVIAAMNPNTVDYQTNDISDAALMDRFCQIKLTPGTDEWAEYMKTRLPSTDHSNVDFFAKYDKYLQGSYEDFNLEVKPSRRKVDIILTRIMPQQPDEHLLIEILTGMLGAPAAVAFNTHLKSALKPLTAVEVLSSFDKHVELYREYSKPESRRSDMLNTTVNDIIAHLEKNDLTKKQGKNFLLFLNTIPLDNAWTICDKLIERTEIRELIESNEEFLKKLEANRDEIKEMIKKAS